MAGWKEGKLESHPRTVDGLERRHWSLQTHRSTHRSIYLDLLIRSTLKMDKARTTNCFNIRGTRCLIHESNGIENVILLLMWTSPAKARRFGLKKMSCTQPRGNLMGAMRSQMQEPDRIWNRLLMCLAAATCSAPRRN